MSLSPEQRQEQCHTHEHQHNRSILPMFDFDVEEPHTISDHHNPFDYGFSSRKNFTHGSDHEHCHIGDRIGHNPDGSDDFGAPAKPYFHVPGEPWEPCLSPKCLQWHGVDVDTGFNSASLGIGEDGMDVAWA